MRNVTGIIWNDRDSLLGTKRQQVALEAAEEQVVAGLHRGNANKVLQFAAAEPAGDPVRRPVGHADVARLAMAHD
jgi:hypothetical protein